LIGGCVEWWMDAAAADADDDDCTCLLLVFRCSGFLFRKVGKPAALAVAGSVVVLQVSLTA